MGENVADRNRGHAFDRGRGFVRGLMGKECPRMSFI
jgi:hypothetical protein